MKFFASLLVAFAAPTVAFYGDRLVSQVEQEVLYTMDMPTLIEANLGVSMERPPKPEVCRKCNEWSNHHIMHAVISHLEEVCKKTQCPVMQHKCELAKAHPQITLGFLLAKVQPWKRSYAFCYGSGHCPHPGPPPHHHGGRCHDRMCLHDGNDFSVLLDYKNNPAEALTELVLTNDGEGNNTCHECIHHTAGSVMCHTMARIKAFCDKAECPCVKRACELARLHPQITLGFMIERVRPGEWGCGYCFGNGTCHAHNETMVDYGAIIKATKLVL